jgi:hypothetical protein
MFVFRPRLLDCRERSKRDEERAPRWAKIPVLGTVIERDGRAVFVANTNHPALRSFGERDLGVADNSNDAMMTRAEEVFRLCQRIKREWKQAKKAERAERAASRGLKIAA